MDNISCNSSFLDDTFSIHSDMTALHVSKNEKNNCNHLIKWDLYCKTHHTMTCRNCLVKQHGLCDVQAIDDVIKECDKEGIEKLVKEIDDIKVKIRGAIKELGNEKSLLYIEKEKATQKIKELRTEMSKRLDIFEKEALTELDLMFSGYKKKTEERLHEVDLCLSSHIENLKSMVLEDDQSIERIVECKESQREIARSREALHKLKIHIPEITLNPDPKLRDVISETKQLGMCQLGFKRDPTVLYQIAERHETRVVLDKGSINCNITGAAKLPDGHVLLADRSNKKLIRIEGTTHRVRDNIKCSSEPWAVCVIHAAEAVVSFPEEQRNVKFISIANKMKVSRSLKLRHTCRGLALDGEELYVSDQGVFIYAYTLNGTLLRKFSKDGHMESKLTDFYAIAVNDSLIVLADWIEGLLAFDKSGKLIWKHNDHDLKRVSGLCFDESGNVLACGSQSINVIHINKEGKKIGEVANTSNGLLYPTALCFDEQKSLLFVAQQEANTVLFRVH